MCLTVLGQIVYGALLLGALALTLGAIFTPQWREITRTSSGDPIGQEGIFTCKYDVHKPFSTHCTTLFQAVAVVWTVISFFACFCKQHILHPLSGFAVFAFLLLLSISLVYYFVYTKELPHDIRHEGELQALSNLGYSYYLCVGAMALALFGAVVGAITACFADKGI
ncbi:CBN-CLC-1 protein [Aphelenchoides avenae]|nr:CBN-CLC-1 protein [Aphelenchus avenae]